MTSNHILALVHPTVVHEAYPRTDARTAEQAGLAAGTEVSLSAKDGELILRPSGPSRLRLAVLLAGVTAEHIQASKDIHSRCCFLMDMPCVELFDPIS
ncbi:MAG: hypothetical protein VKI42_03470 [Synechococcaceae cyanobacterium]|nr:hypothetical protein [Synechococcaceae cyanobacterium]